MLPQYKTCKKRTIAEIKELVKQWDDCHYDKQMRWQFTQQHGLKTGSIVHIKYLLNRAEQLGFDASQNSQLRFGAIKNFVWQKSIENGRQPRNKNTIKIGQISELTERLEQELLQKCKQEAEQAAGIKLSTLNTYNRKLRKAIKLGFDFEANKENTIVAVLDFLFLNKKSKIVQTQSNYAPGKPGMFGELFGQFQEFQWNETQFFSAQDDH